MSERKPRVLRVFETPEGGWDFVVYLLEGETPPKLYRWVLAGVIPDALAGVVEFNNEWSIFSHEHGVSLGDGSARIHGYKGLKHMHAELLGGE